MDYLDGSKKKIYFTWIVFQPGDYQVGSPDWDSAGNSDEQFHTVTLTRAISVLDREVSWDQFDPFDEGTHRAGMVATIRCQIIIAFQGIDSDRSRVWCELVRSGGLVSLVD